jgi:hypothetical protein
MNDEIGESKPLVDRIPFAKIVTMLAVVFGISLGMCGLMGVFSARLGSAQEVAVVFGVLGAGGILISVVGLVATIALWVVLSVVRSLRRK